MARNPQPQNQPVETARLFGAADAILAALHSEQGRRAVVKVLVVENRGPDGPPGFTMAELTEAMSMLLRLGLIESVSRPK